MASCGNDSKSEEFAAKADGRILFLLIEDFRESHHGNLPDNLNMLNYESIRGGLIKNGKFEVTDWRYFYHNREQINPGKIILQKEMTDGRLVSIRSTGEVVIE